MCRVKLWNYEWNCFSHKNFLATAAKRWKLCKQFHFMSILAEPEIVTRKGKPVSVILPIKDYEELIERLEDAEDVAWLKRARQKPLPYRPLEECIAVYRKKSFAL